MKVSIIIVKEVANEQEARTLVATVKDKIKDIQNTELKADARAIIDIEK